MLNNENEVDKQVDTLMTDKEITEFKKEWEEKWTPQNASSQGTATNLQGQEAEQTSETQDDPAGFKQVFQATSLFERTKLSDSEPYKSPITAIKRTFVTDQELAVNGISLREKRELTYLDIG